jgi:hypothetical protein
MPFEVLIIESLVGGHQCKVITERFDGTKIVGEYRVASIRKQEQLSEGK